MQGSIISAFAYSRDSILVFSHTANFHETCRDIITSNYAVSDRVMNPKVIWEKGKDLDSLRHNALGSQAENIENLLLWTWKGSLLTLLNIGFKLGCNIIYLSSSELVVSCFSFYLFLLQHCQISTCLSFFSKWPLFSMCYDPFFAFSRIPLSYVLTPRWYSRSSNSIIIKHLCCFNHP